MEGGEAREGREGGRLVGRGRGTRPDLALLPRWTTEEEEQGQRTVLGGKTWWKEGCVALWNKGRGKEAGKKAGVNAVGVLVGLFDRLYLLL